MFVFCIHQNLKHYSDTICSLLQILMFAGVNSEASAKKYKLQLKKTRPFLFLVSSILDRKKLSARFCL